jgi:hypothetical protein
MQPVTALMTSRPKIVQKAERKLGKLGESREKAGRKFEKLGESWKNWEKAWQKLTPMKELSTETASHRKNAVTWAHCFGARVISC